MGELEDRLRAAVAATGSVCVQCRIRPAGDLVRLAFADECGRGRWCVDCALPMCQRCATEVIAYDLGDVIAALPAQAPGGEG